MTNQITWKQVPQVRLGQLGVEVMTHEVMTVPLYYYHRTGPQYQIEAATLNLLYIWALNLE
jgi:hypothetical protein